MTTNKNLIRFAVVMGALLLIFNVIAFVVPFEKTGTFWVSYIFGMVAILLQALVVKIAFKNAESARSKFYGFPVARIGVVYAVFQVLFSVIFMAVAQFVPFWIPTILFVILLGFSAIGFVAVDATRDEIERQDKKIVADVSYMRNLQSKANILVSQCTDNDIKSEVAKLSEELKYSDPVSNEATHEIERELKFYIEDLQKAIVDNDISSAVSLCKNALSTLAERNRLCKLNKNHNQ